MRASPESRGRAHLPALILILSAAFSGVSLLAGAPSGAVFRAGAATSNITPHLGVSMNGSMRDKTAGHVHDELHARCLVLDDGSRKLVFVVIDSCVLPRPVIDRAKSLASAATGIPAEHMLMSATHTHTAPTAAAVFESVPDPEYIDFLVRRIADGVKRADNLLAPARVGWGSGSVPGQVFNRRWHMKSEVANPLGGRDRVRMNPGWGNPDMVKPAGPTDPELAILSVQSADGSPIAVLANYSLHYVGGVGPGHVSADYFGAFAGRLQELLGADRQDPPFVGIMSNGTSGDINNNNYAVPRPPRAPYEQIRLVADEVAQEAVRVIRGIEHREWVRLDAAQREITLGVRRPTADEVERARGILARGEDPRGIRSTEEIYARETIAMAGYPPSVSLVLQALRIGELAVSAIPCEVFVEIGLELKGGNPFPAAFTISLANGYNGYLPTVEHHALGGYETWRAKSSYLEVEAAPQITSVLMELLTTLHGVPNSDIAAR